MTALQHAPGVSDHDPYREWAPFYPPAAHNALMEVEEHAMLALLPAVAGRRVLDAGGGTGRYAHLMTARGACQVICVDRSASMLRYAVVSCRTRADFAALPIASGSLDLVISGLALMDVVDLTSVFLEWSRVLTPGGAVLCSTLHPRGERLGWTRTFDTPAGQRRLPAFWHSLADVRSACARAALTIDAIAEPALEGAPHAPVALVVRAFRSR
jgi:malonyl-CoA O-methyltransferase